MTMLDDLRSRAQMMLDQAGTECRVSRVDRAAATLDPTTRLLTDPAPTVIYEGVCLLRPEFRPVEAVAADRVVNPSSWLMRLPVGPVLATDDDVILTVAPDDELLTHQWRVVNPTVGSMRATLHVVLALVGRSRSAR